MGTSHRKLAGKVALVTGGARGIGRTFADAFVAHGMTAAVADVDAPLIEIDHSVRRTYEERVR